jgi:hypothetical protein
MTNPVNVEVIVDKQLFYLRTTTDVFLRTDLVSRVTQAAEKYAPNNSWCVPHRATPHHIVARPRVLRPSLRTPACAFQGSGNWCGCVLPTPLRAGMRCSDGFAGGGLYLIVCPSSC